jgi:hypothetical protein
MSSVIYEEREMTKGEYRVGVAFNPSQNPAVDKLKQAAAELIDMIDDEVNDQKDGEIRRLMSLAQTCFEEGAMWAVKAATKTPWPPGTS